MTLDHDTFKTTTPIRQLFINKLINTNRIDDTKKLQFEAYQICLKTIQRIHDQYNIDLNHLNTFQSIKNKQSSLWKWEIIDTTIDYIPTFYQQKYYQLNEIINNSDKYQLHNHYIKQSNKIPSTPYKNVNKIYQYQNIIVNCKDQLCNRLIDNDSILLNNQVKYNSSNKNDQSCNLFTIWKPKIKRDKYNDLNKEYTFKSIIHRSKSLDSYSNNLIQLNYLNEDELNRFSSNIDLHQIDNEKK
ncbi:hypothetical protein MN116_004450 [Schistosoma mekongi]|uniref:Uncharacterized protein n=1 Tax=Schistosoma mekongi TaxID=38744 RepID=A0AAE1ZG84_SCHME|nr:hypothetical protein MN116_004450 [Schistosoma mekongi]